VTPSIVREHKLSDFPGSNATKDWLKRYAHGYLTIECGDWTYGRPAVHLAPDDLPRRLSIGRYCSIGEEVIIFLGRHGRHLTDELTTYPLRMAVSRDVLCSPASGYAEQSRYLRSVQGDLGVTIGDDVWIGTRAIIMAGVTIGTGAVIGAGAVVTTDVSPYAVAVGVPAKRIRFRHDDAMIRRLLLSEWWKLDPNQIWQRAGEHMDQGTLSSVLDRLEGFPKEAESKASLRQDLSNAPQVLRNLSLTELTEQLARGAGGILPRWPSREDQLKYTGGEGVSLLERASQFIGLLEADGAFEGDWKGLDYGCGWGRIASFLLTRGSPEQLDLCDAWELSLQFISRNNFRNKSWKVNELLSETDIPKACYDFIYGFSVFTHLTREAFERNVQVLLGGLKSSGTLYFTVRHSDFLPVLEKMGKAPAISDDSGFWNIVYPGQKYFGETITSHEYVTTTCGRWGKLRYMGTPEAYQHLYALSMR